MGMLDFKLQTYFSMYKDTPLENRGTFRLKFKKKHGEFKYVNELIVMIEKYQIDKYGELLGKSDYGILKTQDEVCKIINASKHRDKYKKRR